MPTPDRLARLRAALGAPAELTVRAPGRINLIGEHTDYNAGFVLPGAVDKAVYIAIRNVAGTTSTAISLDTGERHSFDASTVPAQVLTDMPGWARYIVGVAAQLAAQHGIGAFELAFTGDVPIGAGMSSSAALCCGTALALAQLSGLNLDRRDLARIAQQTEHTYIGLRVGIMDQMASLMGQAGHLLLLDCRDLSIQLVPANLDGYRLVLFDTHVKHELVATEYNQRRQQCERGVATIQQDHPAVQALRDVSPSILAQYRDRLDADTYRRCEYVVSEIGRVGEAVKALEAGDLLSVGNLMNATHAGLRDGYNVSIRELDILQEAATAQQGVLGARMMGGGFGGCTINLVAEDAIEAVTARVAETYHAQTGIQTSAYVCQITAGAGVLNN